ncbi:hypothetical protein FAZ19_15835 [Sphingobacterium alkalisoli]|uniref:Lipoprotein n=1 Tax=Sphingobacterium alkalisoli TaxID=1874115 RepID=A0A4V5LXS8_9SPHI|nr:hypothetical protein [Sphingobacterium alkalisoli]TJY63739.1 hypothetical protein FAZ19_15835 [Sphingobacterium alkalisoli]
MKSVLFASFFMWLACNNKVESKHSDPIVISWVIDEGLHTSHLLIGTSKLALDSLYNNIDYLTTDSVYKSFLIHKHLVNKKTEDYIIRFISANCVSYSDSKFIANKNVYYLGSNRDSAEISCVVVGREKGRAYFVKLKEWLENSPYKRDCNYLIKDIQARFIDGGEFPYTPEQEKLMEGLKK